MDRSGLSGIAGTIGDEFKGGLDKITSIGSEMAQKAFQIGQDIWNKVKAGLGVGSPGYVQLGIAKEFNDSVGRIESAQSPLSSAALTAGKGTVTGYNQGQAEAMPTAGQQTTMPTTTATPTTATSVTNNTSNMPQAPNVTFNISDVTLDNDKRIDQFANAVIKKMSFDTVRAGRSIDNKQYMGG